MFRKLVKVIVALLIANALYRFVPPYVHYVQFKDGVHEALMFSRGVSDSGVADRIARLAEEHGVPLDRDEIEIRHDVGKIYVDASYVQVIRFAPFYSYPWQFDVKTDALQLPSGR